MILMDYSQVSRAAIAQALAENKNMPVEDGLIRHFVVNSVRSNYMKFKKEYGELIICADHRSWRKNHFEHYKGRRALDREKDDKWELINRIIYEVYDILSTQSPIKCVKAPGAEADDIIAWFCNKHGVTVKDDVFGGIGTTVEDILIISGDKDFQQLQRYKNVYQYSPTLKKYIKCPDALEHRKELILKGDVGDGVPNVLSDDDTLMVEGKRQTPVTAKFLKAAMEAFPDMSGVQSKVGATVLERNFARNYKLIDLIESTPADVQATIQEEVNKPNEGSLELLRQSFITYRMKNMLDLIGDFRVSR